MTTDDMTTDDIAAVVAQELGIPAHDIFTKCRQRSVAYARHMFIYVCHVTCPHLSHSAIAKIAGVDRTVACRAIKTVSSLCFIYGADRAIAKRIVDTVLSNDR